MVLPYLIVAQSIILSDTTWSELREGVDYTETYEPEPKEKEELFSENNQNLKPSYNDLDFGFLKPFLFAILIIALVVVLFLLFNSKRGKSFDPVKIEAKTLEEAEENLPEVALNNLLKEYQEAKDFKRSLRIKFLMLLQNLIYAEVITWHPAKTNQAYLREVREKQIYPELKTIVSGFDPVWYGNHSLSEEGYQALVAKIEELKTKVHE